MGRPPSEPPDEPDEPGRDDWERDTEPIRPIRPEGSPADEGPGFGAGPSYSSGPDYSEGPSYSASACYGGYPGGRAGVREPDISAEELAGLQVDASGMPLGARRVLPLEDEPTPLVARYLFPTERYRGEWKRHWIHLATPLLIGIAATFLLGYLSGFLAKRNASGATTVAVLIWLAIMGFVAWRVVDWYFDRFILTNKRVMVVNGIVTRKVAMMPLLRVTDMKYEQSPLGRLLSYGTFVLESAGQEQALRTVSHLPNPNELYLRVVEEMYEPQAVEARLGKDAEDARADDGA
jgi:membrane protein YdbS with pleckstrin-like domain